MTYTLRLCLVLFFCLSWPLQTLAQQRDFPFIGEVERLTPEEIQIQNFKLQRLRIKLEQGRWYIIRGINEKLDDETLLKLAGDEKRLQAQEKEQLVGNSVALGGLVLMGSGGVLLTNIIKIDNATWIGIGLFLVGAALTLGGEMYAGNVGDEYSHIMEMEEAERYIKIYNDKLKEKLGISHLQNLN